MDQILLHPCDGAVLTGVGYIVDRPVWPDHDPVVPVLQLLH